MKLKPDLGGMREVLQEHLQEDWLATQALSRA